MRKCVPSLGGEQKHETTKKKVGVKTNHQGSLTIQPWMERAAWSVFHQLQEAPPQEMVPQPTTYK